MDLHPKQNPELLRALLTEGATEKNLRKLTKHCDECRRLAAKPKLVCQALKESGPRHENIEHRVTQVLEREIHCPSDYVERTQRMMRVSLLGCAINSEYANTMKTGEGAFEEDNVKRSYIWDFVFEGK